ncbi:MAG: glycine cleavage system protein GcvH [Actinobacteria bacterium]|nr:MAG: glycine cleavage system protein GcvH [Actinomycetota bacterium]
MFPKDLRFYTEHEWVRVEGDEAVIGISSFAQDQLGEVVYVDLQKAEGDTLASGDQFGEVESVKSVSELFTPVSGEVLAVNEALSGAPETVNADPYGEAWMVRVKLADPSEVDELMSAEEYEAFVSGV